MYDPLVTYSIEHLRDMDPTNLMVLYKEALGASHVVEGRKQIQKVLEDIRIIRNLLGGYDNIYNREHDR